MKAGIIVKNLKRIISFCVVLTVIVGLFSGASVAADKYELYPITDNHLLNGKVVFIDAGHGEGFTNGAGDYLEEEGNFTQAMLLKDNLERCGATVILTRPTRADVHDYARMAEVNKYALQRILAWYEPRVNDETLSEDARRRSAAAIAELNQLIGVMDSVIADPAANAGKYFNTPWSKEKTISYELSRIFDFEECELVRKGILFVSIHSNTTRDTSYNGTTTYHISNDFENNQAYYTKYSFVRESKRFAEALAEEVSASSDFTNRGAQEENYFMIREMNIPSALVQVAYYTNDSDRAKLEDEYYQKRIAAGMTYAVMKHFDVYVDPYSIKYEMGDVNEDGAIDNIDVVTLARYLLGEGNWVSDKTTDVNSDGKISNGDLVLILRHIVYGIPLA